MSNATTSHPDAEWPQSLLQYNAELSRHMNIRRWKLLKTLFISLMITGLAIASLVEGADPTVIGGLAITAIAGVAGVELGELPVLEIATRTRPNDEERDQ